MPTRPGAHVGRFVCRFVLPVAALAIWGWGAWELVSGSHWGGGALVLTGGLLLVLWAGGGWKGLRSALADWLGGA